MSFYKVLIELNPMQQSSTSEIIECDQASYDVDGGNFVFYSDGNFKTPIAFFPKQRVISIVKEKGEN